MKKALFLMLIISALVFTFSCGEGEEPGETLPPGEETEESKIPPVIFQVGGEEYVADPSTVNIGWLDDEEITDYQKNSFKSFVKVNFGGSKISFTDENSFELTDTYDGFYDFSAVDCQRDENVFTKEIDKKGTVNVVVDEKSIVLYCDFFLNSRMMYFSLTFKPQGSLATDGSSK